jgi:hypothetical protein
MRVGRLNHAAYALDMPTETLGGYSFPLRFPGLRHLNP